MFKDEAKIFVKAGDGGNGCVAFLTEKYCPHGGPAGGPGGKGGDVIIRATHNCKTLLSVSRKYHYIAQNGAHGQGNMCKGKYGKNLIVSVPPGTFIKDEQQNVLCDLQKIGDEFIIAKGGRGGRGNASFATSVNQTPRYAEKGEAGELRTVYLELKLIADVGLVGFPNAGKSTLISRISAAHPKIASYPFTTLIPHLGIVRLSDQRGIVFADLPGIIEGAHKGVGLGDKFLRHIERTRIIVYVLDMLPLDESNPVETFQILQRELALYSPKLAHKKFIIAGNKMDLTGAEKNVENLKQSFSFPVYPISGVTGQGIKELLEAVITLIDSEVSEIPEAETESN